MKSFSILFVFLLIAFAFSACNKRNPKHLIKHVWEAEEEIYYDAIAGGTVIGVGSTTWRWAVLEMDFTAVEKGEYYGNSGSATMLVSDTTGTTSVYDWGDWQLSEFEKGRSFEGFSGAPQELQDAVDPFGEVYNSVQRCYILSLSKRKMEVIFTHSAPGQGNGTQGNTWSPVITFKKK